MNLRITVLPKTCILKVRLFLKIILIGKLKTQYLDQNVNFMNITKNHPNSFLILKNTIVKKYCKKVKKLLNKNDVEINDSKNILTELPKFYSDLFSKKRTKKSEQECSDFIDTITLITK